MKITLFFLFTNIVTLHFSQNFVYNNKCELETSSDTLLPDTLDITGRIISYTNGACGVLCIGSMIEVVLDSSKNNPIDTILIIAPCLTISPKDDLEVSLTFKVSKYTGKEDACYYQSFMQLCRQKIPIYKTSESYVWPIMEYFQNN